MKKVLFILCLLLPFTGYSQTIINNTIYNINAFAVLCCRDLDIGNCLIMISAGNDPGDFGLEGQTSEIENGKAYSVVLSSSLSFRETQRILAHELVHVMQLKTGILKFDKDSVFYSKKKYRNNPVRHSTHVHELEAIYQGNLLYRKHRNILMLPME